MCEECRNGNHDACTEGECRCERRVKQQIEEEALQYQNLRTSTRAEIIYSNLLYGGSPVTRMLTDGAGKDNVKVFIQAVLLAEKSSFN